MSDDGENKNGNATKRKRSNEDEEMAEGEQDRKRESTPASNQDAAADDSENAAAGDAAVSVVAANNDEAVSGDNDDATAANQGDVDVVSLSSDPEIDYLIEAEPLSHSPVSSLDVFDADANVHSSPDMSVLDYVDGMQSHSPVHFDYDSDTTTPPDPPDADEPITTANSTREILVSAELNEILSKQKPCYRWNNALELRQREYGLIANADFKAGYYSSRLVVERMELSRCLHKHNGCVNSLHFNRRGNLLCSGSDDSRIIVWDWAKDTPKHIIRSGHSDNIFQTKFIEITNELDIVSASRDGQVRRTIVRNDGKAVTTTLYRHRNSVHKLLMCHSSPQEIISVGEDGFIRHKDLRNEIVTELLRVMSERNRRVALYGGAHHPYAPEICVCGADEFIRVYDKRNMSKTVYQMSPGVQTSGQVTSCVYNYDGSEILGTYSSDHIYLFKNQNYTAGSYQTRYMGHRNQRTIKGVNFYGTKSEYVISGSDCGHIFIWDKKTEAIMNFLEGDKTGVVNCLEPHPHVPMIATSGLDSNIKLWTPSSTDYPPEMKKLGETIKKNLDNNRLLAHADDNDNQFNFIVRQLFRRLGNGHLADDDSLVSFDELLHEDSFSSDSSLSSHYTSTDTTSSDENDTPVERVQCPTQ